MTSLAKELEHAVRAKSVQVTDETITVRLMDGRTVLVPTKWYPRLLHATAKERGHYEIDSYGITWPEVEADFSIRGILLGHKSGESAESLRFWRSHRGKGQSVKVEDYIRSRKARRSVAKN